MIFKLPENDQKYQWTNHVKNKMIHYRISESLIKRIIRFPKRVEEGVALGTTAVMQPSGSKGRPQEIWVMYRPSADVARPAAEVELGFASKSPLFSRDCVSEDRFNLGTGKIKIISAWRYPGVSPIGKPIPIPEEILQELGSLVE